MNCALCDGICAGHEWPEDERTEADDMEEVERTDADDVVPEEVEDSVWKSSYVNDLPNSAFLFISPGGSEDESGKTVPRSLRHFPVRDAEGRLDLVHVRAAVDMAPKANLPAHIIADVQDRARKMLEDRGQHHHPARMDAEQGDETREDTLRLDASRVKRTEQGGVKMPGALTKVGVFRYRRKDGTTIREYRPADEVFSAESLATLEDAPVTDLHPAKMVDTLNYATLAKGHVRDVKKDGSHAVADTIVQDGTLANKVLSGERVEISCGYRCKLDTTAGIFNGMPYDAIQRNIRYNHVALLPRGAGRQGPDVALRFDACQDHAMVIKFDGKDYDTSDAAETAAYQDAVLAHSKAATAAELKNAKDRADSAEGQRDAAISELAPYKAEKAAEARTKLETKARKILGSETKFDGLTDREIMERVLNCKKIDHKGKEDSYVRGCFDSFETPAETTNAGLAAGFAAMQPLGAPAAGAATAPVNPLANRWQQPLTASKDRK